MLRVEKQKSKCPILVMHKPLFLSQENHANCIYKHEAIPTKLKIIAFINMNSKFITDKKHVWQMSRGNIFEILK